MSDVIGNITFQDIDFECSFFSNTTLSKIKNHVWDAPLKVTQKSQIFSRNNLTSEIKRINVSRPSQLNNREEFNVKNVSVNRIQTDLQSWGLPPEIVNKYERRGVKNMFQWQVECLGNSNVLEYLKNLVYSAPTSAGKTLVAEILTIKTVLERFKKVIVILPFVSVVREKMFYFQDIFSESGVRVEGFMGSHNPPGGFQAVHIAICTIEKANSLINRLLEENTIADLGAIIVDELHLLGDPHRGYILELLLTKILYVNKKYDNVNIQIVGMSATLPNLNLLSSWLGADLYKTDFRPIPLEEQCLIMGEIYNSNFQLVRKLSNCEELPKDNDYIVQMCLETIMQGCSILIFCSTKNWCENLAQQISAVFCSLGYSNSDYGINLRKQLKSEEINEVLMQLKHSPVGLDKILSSTISFGVAFHHAGLTLDERDIIEGAFKRNAIRVLIATSTLSSGVNLPARRVIIRSPTFYSKPIDVLTYKQMIGRAGRMGIDSAGESILICSPNERKIAIDLISKPFEPISSCLEGGDRLMRAVLEAIASKIALNKTDVRLFIECTLLMNDSNEEVLENYCEDMIKKLQEYELIKISKNEDSSYVATPLGKACLSSSMSPQDGLTLFIELQKARESFVLETDLHMIYLVTPYSICSQWGDLNWLNFLNLWERLSPAMKRVGKLIGIQESFIYRCMRNCDKRNTPDMLRKHQIYKRFYTALALQDLVNEIPLNVVANKFSCSRGMLQSLQQSAATFSGMVTAFSHQLGWKSFEVLVSQFQDRLHFGIQSELIDLMKLQSLNGIRARAIFNFGIETVCQLAIANIDTLENALNSAIPFESEKIREGEHEYDANKRNNMKSFWITGKAGITTRQAAELLIVEAQTYLKLEMGVSEVKWKSQTNYTRSESSNGFLLSQNVSHVQEDNITSTVKSNSLIDDFNTSTDNSECNKSNTNNKCNVSANINEHSTPKSSDLIKSESITLKNVSKSDSDLDFEESIFDSSHSDSNELKSPNKNDMSDSIFKSDLSKSLSLFDESLNVDTQLCGILDKKATDKDLNKENKISNSCENSQSLTCNPLSLEKVFMKSFDINVNTDIASNNDEDLFQCTENIIPDSQTDDEFELTSKIVLKEKSSIIRFNKRKHPFDGNTLSKDKDREETNDCSPRKQIKLINNSSVIDLTLCFDRKTEINTSNKSLPVYYCDNYKIFNKLQNSIIHVDKIAVYVDYEIVKVIDPRLQIGYNIINKKAKENEIENDDKYNSYIIKGIAIFIEKFEVFYVDLQMKNSGKHYRDEVINFLKMFFINRNRKIIIYNAKQIYHVLYKCYDIKIDCDWEDPLIADWLLDSECSIKSLYKMAAVYSYLNIDNLIQSYQGTNDTIRYDSIACINAWVTWNVMKSLKKLLFNLHERMMDVFDIEMKALKELSHCEISGIPVNNNEANMVFNQIKSVLKSLEENAFKIAGRRFKFNSSLEVAKVLGIYKGRKTSTSKRKLEKVVNPLAEIVIYWRKLNAILTKNIFPLLPKITFERIFGTYWTHTATGRMSMQEPNVQSMPRNFKISSNLVNRFENESIGSRAIFISCRNIFESKNGKIFISADYCQLELRLLTHMCKDSTLVRIVKSGKDIFNAIASSWKCIPENEVDDDLRQKTKQMCYGIIYGMGIKTLAQNLDVSELDADIFMRTFHTAYPGIKIFINNTIESCRRLKYVETLSGRRRYLPLINSSSFSEKAHAERQAVNTAIQGSAADILKSAMISVRQKMNKYYKDTSDIKLVLLLHDELMYEISEEQLNIFVDILKRSMENTIKLDVPLTVKVKYGKKWGNMTEI